MAILLTCLTWARKVPTQVWLGVVAVLLAAGWLHAHDAKVRAEALAASQLRAANHERDRLRQATVEITVQRDQLLDSTRKLADAVSIKAAFLSQKVVTFHVTPPPVPSVTPSGDSVTFAKPVWEQHVALDAQKDSTLDDLSALARDGIPAIRNQYEAVLAKDVKLFALKDSLIGAADARARYAAAMNPKSHWHAVVGPCYAVGPTGHHGVALCATVGWSPF